jgi:hypothetical protein
MIEPAAGAASIVQGEAVSIGPAAAVADSVIWIVRLRTGRVVTFRASGSRAFRAAALTASVAAVDLAVIVSAAAADLADSVVIASVVVAALAAEALGDLGGSAAEDFAAAVEGSGADDDINVLN